MLRRARVVRVTAPSRLAGGAEEAASAGDRLRANLLAMELELRGLRADVQRVHMDPGWLVGAKRKRHVEGTGGVALRTPAELRAQKETLRERIEQVDARCIATYRCCLGNADDVLRLLGHQLASPDRHVYGCWVKGYVVPAVCGTSLACRKSGRLKSAELRCMKRSKVSLLDECRYVRYMGTPALAEVVRYSVLDPAVDHGGDVAAALRAAVASLVVRGWDERMLACPVLLQLAWTDPKTETEKAVMREIRARQDLRGEVGRLDAYFDAHPVLHHDSLSLSAAAARWWRRTGGGVSAHARLPASACRRRVVVVRPRVLRLEALQRRRWTQ